MSGRTDRDQHTLFLKNDNGIIVFNIIYGVSRLEITGRLRQYGLNDIAAIVSDGEPTTLCLPSRKQSMEKRRIFNLMYDNALSVMGGS